MNILVFVIVFLAVLTQSIAGFGLALVSMGLLSQALGVKTTAPLSDAGGVGGLANCLAGYRVGPAVGLLTSAHLYWWESAWP